MRRVLLAMAKGVTLSACNAFWEDFLMGAPIEWAMGDLIILVSAPVSRVSYGDDTYRKPSSGVTV